MEPFALNLQHVVSYVSDYKVDWSPCVINTRKKVNIQNEKVKTSYRPVIVFTEYIFQHIV